MKIPSLCLASCLALAACGGSDKDSPPPKSGGSPTEQITPRTPPSDDAPAKSRSLRVSEEAQQALRDRVETMKEITAVLKPLVTPKPDPEGALAAEESLQALFAEYDRLGKIAMDEGLTRFEIAGLTAKLAPDQWSDSYKEFTQYHQLVRQLGEPQREMMDRLMGTKDPASTGSALQNHLDKLKAPTTATPESSKLPKLEPAKE